MSATLSIPGGERCVFAARLDQIPATATFIEAFCARIGVATPDVLRLTLIVEELFTNSVLHGYGGDCDAPIELALTFDAGDITLLYEDAADEYDPLSGLDAEPDHVRGTVESRPVGGLGIHLVRELIAGARYAREAGRNRLWLRIAGER